MVVPSYYACPSACSPLPNYSFLPLEIRPYVNKAIILVILSPLLQRHASSEFIHPKFMVLLYGLVE